MKAKKVNAIKVSLTEREAVLVVESLAILMSEENLKELDNTHQNSITGLYRLFLETI